jgi:glycosyltransferase involved in cell wall biosynthesis
MKTLVLVTSQFPFGTGESFIGSEFPFLQQAFEKIIIIAQNISGERTRQVSGNVSVYRYNTSTSLTGLIYLPVLIVRNLGIITELVREEKKFRKSIGKPLSPGNFSFLFRKIIKSVQLRDFIVQTVLQEQISGSFVYYSYWFKTGANALSLPGTNGIKIARAHGSDIYEERTGKGYLPLLKYTATHLNGVFFISKNGKAYLEEKFGIKYPHFLVSYLGVSRPDSIKAIPVIPGKFVIVSCSNLVPLKRIDLIIKALKEVNSEKNLEWLHFGTGPLKNELEDIAQQSLGQLTGKTYRFMGQFSNEELLKYYSENHVDLFINTSSTEGIPVSIMEAQSFGIPVIATDTGGVKEIVVEGTGTLLPVNLSPQELARQIERFMASAPGEIEAARTNAINNWKINFNATANYTQFIRTVNSILAPAD